MAKTISPNRRRSIAVLDQQQPAKKRRRASSLAPKEKEKRRHLAPRKSILKASLNLPDDEEEPTTSISASTSTYTTASRKSLLARRVSFAAHAHVRIFEKDNQNNTNSTASPNSSPTRDADAQAPAPAPQVNDENAYPGADGAPSRRRSSIRRRRSSTTRPSGLSAEDEGEGEESMDLDDTMMAPPLLGSDDSMPSSDGPWDDDDGMDLTGVHAGDILRRRSTHGRMSIMPGSNRRRSSTVHLGAYMEQQDDEDEEHTQDRASTPAAPALVDASYDDSTTSSAQSAAPEEYTVPLAQALKPPSAEWLALAAMTHSGEADAEDDTDDFAPAPAFAFPAAASTPARGASVDANMSLEDAMARLGAVKRQSWGAVSMAGSDMSTDTGVVGGFPESHTRGGGEDDSFGSSQDSFEDDIDGARPDMADRTLNLSAIMGRASLAGGGMGMGRMSLAPEPSMEITRIAGPSARRSSATSGAETEGDGDEVLSVMDHTAAVGGSQPWATQTQAESTSNFGSPARRRSSLGADTGNHTEAMKLTTVVGAPVAATSNNNAGPSRASVFSAPSTAPARSALSQSQSAPSSRPFVFSAPPRASLASGPLPADQQGQAQGGLKPPFVFQARSPSPAASPSAAPAPPPFAFGLSQSQSAPVRPPQGQEREQAEPRSAPASPAKASGSGFVPYRDPAPVVGEKRAVPEPAETASPAKRRASVAAVGASPSKPVPSRVSFGAAPPPRRKSVVAPSPRKSFGAGRSGIAAPSPLHVAGEGTLYPNLDAVRAGMGARGKEQERGEGASMPGSLEAADESEPGPRAASPAARNVRAPAQTQPRWSFMAQPATAGFADVGVPEVDNARSRRSSIAPVREDDGERPRPPIEPISLQEFFEATGITFMDEMTVPVPRRSLAPAARRRRSSSLSGSGFGSRSDAEKEAEYFLATARDVPRVEIYGAAARWLQACIDSSAREIANADADARKVMPTLFEEFLGYDFEDREMLLGPLRIIKTNSRELSKALWYDTKLEWILNLQDTADVADTELRQDLEIMRELQQQSDAILPALREEYAQVTHELEVESAEVEEILQCDQDELNELKASILEQDQAVELFRVEAEGKKAQLKRLEQTLVELDEDTRAVNTAIEKASRVLDRREPTLLEDIQRKAEDLAILEWVFMWRVTKLRPDVLELVFDDRYRVTVPCIECQPVVAQVQIRRERTSAARAGRTYEWFPGIEDVFIGAARLGVHQLQHTITRNSQIAQLLANYWAACGELRRELEALVSRGSHEFEIDARVPGRPAFFKVTVPLLFEAQRAKALVSFAFDEATFASWPHTVAQTRVEVEVDYGAIRGKSILVAIQATLADTSPSRSRGCLTAAVENALSVFDSQRT